MERYRPQPKKTDEERRRERLRALDNALAFTGPKARPVNPYKLPEFPQRLMAQLPPEVPKLAMDQAFASDFSWAASFVDTTFSEGLNFLGYPFLSELAQRPEYRIIVETIAGEMCRKWIKFTATGDDQDAKADKLKALEDRFKDLEVQMHFRKVAEYDGYFGRAHLYLDFADKNGQSYSDNREELITPVGDGQDKRSRAKLGKNCLIGMRPIEPIWSYPTNYNASDPLKYDWYNPQRWFVMGKEVHVSRFLTFVGREVPDLLKPVYSFGGLSLSQIAKPYVDIWIKTRQSVADLIHSFVVWGLKTNLSESLMMQGEELFKRLELFNRTRDNRGVMLIDKELEDWFNQNAPLGSLDALQAQAQEHMMSVARIPAVKFTGLQPTGLNASSDGEIRAFYDTILDRQENFFRPNLTKVMHFVQLDLWGEIDPEITFEFEPLWSMDEKEHAEVRKMDVETAQILVDTGIIDQAEERARIADDPDTLYPGLEKAKLPDLKQEEEGGLVPEGGGRVTTELEKEESGEGGERGMSEGEGPEEDAELGPAPRHRLLTEQPPEVQQIRNARMKRLMQVLDMLPPEELNALLDRYGPEQSAHYIRGLPKEAAE